MATNQSTSEPKFLNITDAAKALGIKPFHCHGLVTKGKFPGAKKELIPGTKTYRWMIPVEAIATRKATVKGGVGKRADGRNKYTIYLNPEELSALTKAFPKAIINRANPKKEEQTTE